MKTINKIIKPISTERKKYLQKKKKQKILVLLTQIFILIAFLGIWEWLANNKIIDSFITSQPSRIWKTFMNLGSNDLITHIKVTTYETVVGFLLGTFLGIIIAIILWWSEFLAKVADPYLVVLNSLPKVALRTNYNNMGRSRNTSNYSYGSSNFTYSNNPRKPKRIPKNRRKPNKNGKNIQSNQTPNSNQNCHTSKHINIHKLPKSQYRPITSRCNLRRIPSIKSRTTDT